MRSPRFVALSTLNHTDNDSIEDVTEYTVIDGNTNLEWFQNASSFPRQTWKEANKLCNSLERSWRLPSITELLTLVDRERGNTWLPKEHPFNHVQGSGYWSNEVCKYDSSRAWLVSLDGVVVPKETYLGFYVWPVRDSESRTFYEAATTEVNNDYQ